MGLLFGRAGSPGFKEVKLAKRRASITAEGIAYVRAFESSKPAGERICDDPLARRLISPAFYLLGKLFIGYGESRAPGVVGFLAVRCRYIDDYLVQCIQAGIEQVVIMGAGLDSRAYRTPGLAGRVRVFEVDQPATQQVKVDKLKKVLGSIPQHVTFVPIDFNEESLDKLFAHGYRRDARTLFIWEGVVYYLTAEAVDKTLAFIAGNSGPGSSIIFDYVYASALVAAERGEIKRMRRARRWTGEGLTFGIEEGQVEAFLEARGFVDIHNATTDDLKRAYFTGPNQARSVAPIYAIVHATVK